MRTRLTKAVAVIVAVVGMAVVDAYGQTRPPSPAAPEQAAGAAPSAAFQAKTPAEKAVAARIDEFVKAYEASDAQALTALYTDDGVVVDSEGLEAKGKDEIAHLYSEAFQEPLDLKLENEIQELKFLTPDVARMEGRSRLSVAGGEASAYARFSVLAVQKDGVWKIAELREYPAPLEDVEPYQRLKDLEWMVGSWVNEGSDAKVTAEVVWAENRSYLIRTHSAEIGGEKASSGTMFIGWDPQTGQIRSWLFDSEGGRGEGVWIRVDENQWIVRAQGVMRDGLPTSATQIHTILNKDSVKTDSVDRLFGGVVDEDIVDVVMVRKAPAPNVKAPSAAQ